MKTRSLFVLFLLAAALLTSVSLVAAQDEPIKVGLGFDLTGGESALDLPASNGAQLAIKEINAAGGVLGRPLEGVSHDTRYDMALTAQIARSSSEQTVRIRLVASATRIGAGLRHDPTGSGIPFITAGATSPQLPEHVGDLFLMACFGENVQ